MSAPRRREELVTRRARVKYGAQKAFTGGRVERSADPSIHSAAAEGTAEGTAEGLQADTRAVVTPHTPSWSFSLSPPERGRSCEARGLRQHSFSVVRGCGSGEDPRPPARPTTTLGRWVDGR